jgi:hypothetical protein
MTKRNGDRDHLRVPAKRNAIEIADQLCEEFVGVEFLDEHLQECARPGELRGTLGKLPHRTRTQLLAPTVGIELLFRPDGIFELAIDVDDHVTELAHGCTSTSSARTLCAGSAGGPGPTRV